MILVIDNYDSFTYNLVQYLGELGADPVVRRNDAMTVDEIEELGPEAIVISPGPGTPADAGVSVDVIRRLGAKLPLLGVCLGHQAIAEAYGGRVVRAPALMHGKTSKIKHSRNDLFDGLDSPLEVMRYHSLTVEAESLPAELEVLAWGLDDATEIHAMRHREHPVWGVQFHPESVMTQSGRQLLANFLRMSKMRIPILGVIAAAVLGFAGAADAQSKSPEIQTQPADTNYVTYDDGPISLPLGIGLRVPQYNRVDGLVLPWGPKINLASGRIEIDPTVTYRSHIGALDGRGRAKLHLSQFDEIVITGGRETFTNDAWIRSDLVNSLGTLGAGNDARNYFRADRIIAAYTHEFVGRTVTWRPTIGFLHENAWSTGVATPHSSAPWSVIGRTDDEKMRRPNPAILEGHTTSGTGGLGFVYEEMDVRVRANAGVEHAFDSPPVLATEDGHFTQVTLHSDATFPTFGLQHFDFRGHAVFGSSDDVPPQRYAYLGGTGTLPTVDLLALGGDRLVFLEGEYIVPLRRPMLPFIGAPVVSLHYAVGSAGIGELPDFIQNIGVGLGVRLVKVQYHIDPNFKDTEFRRKHAFSFGFDLSL